MKPCPWCAEPIQEAALICRFCQREVATSGPLPPPVPPVSPASMHGGGRYDTPFRFDQQSASQHTGGPGGGTAFSASSSGVALKGHVCPSCLSDDYVTRFSIWHGVIALGFFPLGLIGLAFPVKVCVKCRAEYGAGREMTRVMGIMALLFMILVLFFIAAIAAS